MPEAIQESSGGFIYNIDENLVAAWINFWWILAVDALSTWIQCFPEQMVRRVWALIQGLSRFTVVRDIRRALASDGRVLAYATERLFRVMLTGLFPLVYPGTKHPAPRSRLLH